MQIQKYIKKDKMVGEHFFSSFENEGVENRKNYRATVDEMNPQSTRHHR